MFIVLFSSEADSDSDADRKKKTKSRPGNISNVDKKSDNFFNFVFLLYDNIYFFMLTLIWCVS